MDISEVKTFKQFVMEQSATAPLNHGGGWFTCAVGDYMDVVLGCRELASPSNQKMITAVIDDHILEACLANHGHAVVYDHFYKEYTSDWGDFSLLTTYGDIQDYYTGDLKIDVADHEL